MHKLWFESQSQPLKFQLLVGLLLGEWEERLSHEGVVLNDRLSAATHALESVSQNVPLCLLGNPTQCCSDKRK